MSCCGGPRTGREFDPDCEGPSARDLEQFGGDDATCPHCGTEVYHDAAMCHSCGEMIEESAGARRPIWIAVAGATALLGFVLVAVL